MAAGEIETMEDNIQDWLEPDGDVDFSFWQEEIAALIFFFINTTYVIKFYIYLFCSFLCLLGLSFASLIRKAPYPNWSWLRRVYCA
jgi:hypothetical protein